MMAIIFAAIVPIFGQIRGGWDSKQAAAETLQNGRILIDHLNRNLSKAVRITAVSDSSETDGYIEFEDNDANNLRYDVNSLTDYVEFGYIGDLSDLAGPVSRLQFTCYDACDLDTPITDVNSIRFVKVEAIFTNSATLGQDKTFIASAYLRTNGNNPSGGPDPYTGDADAAIPQTASPPTIDGSVDSMWSDAIAYPLNNVVEGTVDSESDLSGTWKALWDTSNLYYLVDITDDYLHNDSGLYWQDDCIEIYIDADNSKGRKFDNVNDFQFSFRWNDTTLQLGGSSTDTSGVDFVIVDTSNGYRLEVSFPWSALKVTPSQGHLIGADVFVNDDDDGGDTREAQKTWYATSSGYWNNPNEWGTAELVGNGSGSGGGQILP